MDSLADMLAGTAGTIVGSCDLSPRLFESKSSSVRRWNYRGTNTSREVYQRYGFLGFYQGLGPKVMKSSIRNPLCFFCNDFWVELIDDYICKVSPKAFRCMRVHTL